MMKKLLYFLVAFWVFGNAMYAQEQSDHKGEVLNGGAVYKNIDQDLQMQFQIGGTFLYPMEATQHVKAGFPFGVFYAPNTFSENTFEVSKGYYEDNIRVSWSIGANEDNITKIQIFRKTLEGSGAYQLIATLGSTVFEYLDTQVEGGVLYQYKVSALGVSNIEQKFVTFIEGIGFRNPTAFVSGSITFEGGSPVKDVTVFAEPIGAEATTSVGTSIQFKDYAEQMRRSFGVSQNTSTKAISVQGWFAPSTDQENQKAFYFQNDDGELIEMEFYYSPDGNGKKIMVQLTNNGTTLASFELKNSYPTGAINASGKDVFANITDVTNTTFVHLSAVLSENAIPKIYINGRAIIDNYITNATVTDGVTKPSLTNVVAANYNGTGNILKSVGIGSDFIGYVDEFRVWSKALSNDEVRRDYKRYLDGSESKLEMYNRMDEGTGNFAYDLSKKGFNFNKNDLTKTVFNSTNTVFSDVIPTKNQLGIFGITDSDGSYAISAIPYAGSGEQFKITPSFGVHKFKPASQTLFLGREESVVNQVDFDDVSSFKFNGRIVYDARNVFKTIEITDPALETINEIREVGYNQYLVNQETIINKGQYYYEGGTKDEDTGNLTGGTLKSYPVIGLEDANVYIDGNLVFDADNQPVVTDAEGKFAINVPIGKHKIEVRKQGHVYALDGRFPEKTQNTITNLFDFYEDQIQERWFIDETRVTVVGRVVGGKTESDKKLGFGLNGLRTYEYVDENDVEQEEIISSVNNIGVATITFKGTKNTNELDVVVNTNAKTGEYKVDLIPFVYSVKQVGGINVASNTDINSEFLDSDEELNFVNVVDKIKDTHTTVDGVSFQGEPYNFTKSFRYNSPVTIELISQEFENSLDLEYFEGSEKKKGNFKVGHLTDAFYLQSKNYKLLFEVSQDYVNKDGAEDVKVKEFYTEGEFDITNPLEVSGETKIKEVVRAGKTQYEYQFTAGFPNISVTDGFVESINVSYNLPDGGGSVGISNASPLQLKESGVIMGVKSTGGSTFVTSAPELPSMILRDPPGSNSFASITKGTTFSFDTSISNTGNSTVAAGVGVSMGADLQFGVGLGFVKNTTVDITADVNTGISTSITKGVDNTSSFSMTFEETISTSDDPNFVGADGDLYIGNSKNVHYGLINKTVFTKELPLNKVSNTEIDNKQFTLKNTDGNDVEFYLSAPKTRFTIEKPTQTYFIYSQQEIINNLIPELRALANEALVKEGQGQRPTPSSTFYLAQADLWEKVIQDNERQKYRALNNKDQVKTSLTGIVDNIDFSGADKAGLKTLLNDNFFSNRSFDAGVGEYTNTVTTTAISSKTYDLTIDIDSSFETEIGAEVDGIGATVSYSVSAGYSRAVTQNVTTENTTSIAYTLKDNDDYNKLSVDVVSMFDGNGPVFASKGGFTSCPYEGETVSNYFTNSGYNPNTVGSGGDVLSQATIAVYKPEVLATKTNLIDIPESEGAVFVLKLKNVSPTGNDLEHLLFIDNTSLGGATSNVDQNGVSVFLPYNETVEFPIIISKNPSLSKYTFEGIKIYLGDPCEGVGDITESESADDITLSVTFKKSCSKVALSAPQENWVYNRDEAFTADANGNVINNVLPITFTDFNTDFTGFRKIELQYRNANSSSWTKFKAYYGSQQLKDDASDDTGVVIESQSEFTFNWDIVGNKIVDGTYELRAVAFCTDDITYESQIIKGTINLTPPSVFGTPQPSDGILDIGEDIKVRFNEPISQGVATNITLRGLQNQQAIDHSVTVALDGGSNKIELPKQDLLSKNFSIQFWLDNNTTASGVLLNQINGPKISLNGDNVTFELDGETLTTAIDGSQYNFYSFIYQNGNTPFLRVLQNGQELKTESLDRELSFNNSNSIFVGGDNILGNIHDIRIWSKATTAGLAAAEKDLTLSGNEINLIGYWPLNEGNGNTGRDLVRSRNAKVNLSWFIKPKGQGYAFDNNSYLTLDNVAFVQPTNFEDITMSFWLKANTGESGTIFSNGSGNANLGEPILTNGFRNKWNIELLANGNLKLRTEGRDFALTNKSVSDGNWHHFSLLVKRSGGFTTFVDGAQNVSGSSQNIGGIAGAKMYLGAKYSRTIPTDANGVATGNPSETIDNHFTGKLDEFRIWNSARSFEQIKRDRFFEIDVETQGLLLYAKFNEEDANVASKGPRYNTRKGDGTVLSYLAELNGASRKFIEDSPAIKSALKYINIPFTTIVNMDEMIISPTLTNEEWSLFEGQILDVSVSNMYDVHFNRQLSPLSFSAFVNRQEMEWFTVEGTKEIVTEKVVNEPFSFTMDVVNKGGNNQDFSVSGLPSYVSASLTSGTVRPNSTTKITFVVDKEIAMGNYNTDIYLQLNNGYSDRLSLQLRVIQQAPDWSVKASDYSYSMNMISQIKINSELSRDNYTKVGAFVDNKKRGEAYLVYDSNYDAYYAYLTIYSNVTSNETVTFKVWDALNGKIRIASIDGQQSTQFLENDVRGSKSSPVIFDSGDFSEQNISLNKGWTWVSFFVEDTRFSSVDNTFNGLNLFDGDLIKYGSQFTQYENGFWSGSLTTIENKKAYKIKLKEENSFRLIGNEVNARNVNISIESGWNWFAFPIHRNISVADALAFFEPTDGDVIKDQFNFAIYDANSKEWTGTLRYFQANRGYMLRAAKAQTFNYPSTNNFGKSGGSQDTVNELVTIFAEYQNTMGIIAEIHGSETLKQVKIYDANNNLRGVSRIEELNGKKLAFINVFSNENETLSYRLVDDLDKEVNLSENVTFVENAVLGTLKEPVQLNQKALSTENLIFKSITLYPNPFTSEIIINSGDGSSISKVIVYNTLGKTVLEQIVNSDVVKLNTDRIAAGVYMVKLINDKGNFVTKKVVKTE